MCNARSLLAPTFAFQRPSMYTHTHTHAHTHTPNTRRYCWRPWRTLMTIAAHSWQMATTHHRRHHLLRPSLESLQHWVLRVRWNVACRQAARVGALRCAHQVRGVCECGCVYACGCLWVCVYVVCVSVGVYVRVCALRCAHQVCGVCECGCVCACGCLWVCVYACLWV